MYKTFTMELAGRTLSVDIGRVAAQANGAAFMRYGNTVVLSTATASEKPREGIDFFPLSVEYHEKMYSVGRIRVVLRDVRENQVTIPSLLVVSLTVLCAHYSQKTTAMM